MFKKDLKTASVSRLGYITSWWYKKSWYTATGKSYKWSLKFLTLKDWIDIWAFGKEAQFNTDITADIKESDRLTIDWINFDVKGVADFPWVTFGRKMLILNKS
jgi:hypothetical protein